MRRRGRSRVYSEKDLAYALIHVLDPARAAQYAALVEEHRLAATPARTQDEALFHAGRLGPAALLLIELHSGVDGFALLQRLRRAKQTCPALVISSSWELRNEAMRLRKKLGIAEVLAPSQPLATVQKAVARALGPREARPAEDILSFPEPSRKPGPPPQALEEMLGQTARSLRASMALAWLEDGRLHGHFGGDPDRNPMVGTAEEWGPFRQLASTAPVDVRRCADDKVLSRSPLVIAGKVGSFAGAPLVDREGKNAGVLWVAQREPDGLVPNVLHPLTVWAQRIGSSLDELAVASVRSTAPAPRMGEPRLRPSTVDSGLALGELVAGLETGLIVTDADDRIATSNPAVLRLLGLRNRRLTGLMRGRVVERLRLHSALDGRTAARLLEPRTAPLRLEAVLHRPSQHILSWETRPLRVGLNLCRVDEIAEVTAEVQQRDALQQLVRVDGLTLLGNRKSFDEALAREISRAHRAASTLSSSASTTASGCARAPPT